jgi:dolichyl-diphosphooligosaccharide--protein glycosyltransferase
MPRTGDDSSLRRIVSSGAFFVVAFGVRVVSWPLVLLRDPVQPAGSDAFYHLRRILYGVENFPRLLSRDPYLNFPHGGEVIWSPVFDWLLAALAWVFVGPGDSEGVARLLVWVPPVLGASTVAGAYWWAARSFSPRVAALTAGLLAVLPAHVVYSQIGAIDHHVAVSLCALGLLAAGLRLAEAEMQGPWPQRGALLRALWLGLAMAAALAVWPGALLHVAIVQLLLALQVVREARREAASARSLAVAAAQAVACLAILPLSVGNRWEVWGSFSPVVLSNFQPVYLAASALGFAALSLLWQRWSFSASWPGRLAQASALLAVAAGAALLALPSLGEALLDAWSWFAKVEEFQGLVAESAPLFSRGSGFEPGRAELLLSRAVYLAPFAISWLGWRAKKQGGSERTWGVLGFAAALFVATLIQRRFMNSFALPFALVLAMAAEQLFGMVSSRLGPGLAGRLGVAAAASLAGLWLLLPTHGAYANDLANLGRLLRGEAPRAVGTALLQATLLPVASWIAENTPETRGFFDASLQPEYSLLSAWGDGHLLTSVARRPQVQGNFGDDVGAQNFALAEQYFSASRESDAVSLLDRMGARYVVASRTGSGHAQGYAPNSMWARMYLPARSAGGALKLGKKPPTIDLSEHRLVHTSRRPPPNSPRFPYFAVYERVAGAQVVGRAPPGTRVEARLKLVMRDDGELSFRVASVADARGRYRLRLPYSNEGAASSLRVGRRYRLESGGQTALLQVAESLVQSGAELAGPDFSGR